MINNNNNNNLVSVYNSNGKFLKKVYSRYAIQQVRKGKAYFSSYSTIVLGKAKHHIISAFPKIGDTLSVSQAMNLLESLFANQLFPRAKAKGSLGGAARSKFIEFNPITSEWKRIR